MKLTLLISSLACLALLVYAPIETFMLQEYHTHQKNYRKELTTLAETKGDRVEATRYPIRIRQLVIPELERIDRCVSCHVALEDPRMANAEQPLKTHPGNYLKDHDVQKIGCTVCHDGQGRALLREDAHAVSSDIHWDKPMLRSPFIQANCMRCHEIEELPGLEHVRKGSELFNSKGCMGCHKLEERGGGLAPELTNISDASPHLKHAVTVDSERLEEMFQGNENLAYIFESVKQPNAQPPDTAMMDFKLSDDEALAVTVFLKGLSKLDVPASYLAKRDAKRHRKENLSGEKMFAKYCSACHGEGGEGGVENLNYGKETVPSLNTLAQKMFIEYSEDAEYVAELLEDGVDIENMSPPLDIDARARVLAQFKAIKDVIKKGSIAAKADAEGPTPQLHMPRWEAGGLQESDIHNILAYLLILNPWEEEEEEEEEE